METLEDLSANLITKREASKFLRLSEQYVGDLARRHEIPAIRIRGRLYFKKDELVSILNTGLPLPEQNPVIQSEEAR